MAGWCLICSVHHRRSASPFCAGRKSDLQELVPGTLYGPYATSLRMSDLGYQNSAQTNLHVSFNSLPEYTDALEAAIRTPDPYYQQLGVRDGDHWKQLSANLLQIENEFYAAMRPQTRRPRPPGQGAAPAGCGIHRDAAVRPQSDGGHRHRPRAGHLCRRAAADVPVSRQPAHQCAGTGRERREQAPRRHPRDASRDLHLLVHNREQPIRPLAHELFDDMAPFADMLDTAYGDTPLCRHAMDLLRQAHRPSGPVHPRPRCWKQPAHTRASSSMQWQCPGSTGETLLAQPLQGETLERFEISARDSLALQRRIEENEQGSFEDYVAGYYA
jgi:glutamate--cysteine ligase